jgi:hypothetical protein
MVVLHTFLSHIIYRLPEAGLEACHFFKYGDIVMKQMDPLLPLAKR